MTSLYWNNNLANAKTSMPEQTRNRNCPIGARRSPPQQSKEKGGIFKSPLLEMHEIYYYDRNICSAIRYFKQPILSFILQRTQRTAAQIKHAETKGHTSEINTARGTL